jgi:F0F1-type ATP synthase membrane subunit b/b'
MSVYVTRFFGPANPKRPANFVVIKYFLLGLLISNSIESILIIPKILDVLDQSRIQVKELEEINIKKDELKELVAEKEKDLEEMERERNRELKVLLKEKTGRKEEEEEEEEEWEEEREKARKQHQEQIGHHTQKIPHHSVDNKAEEVTTSEIRKRPQRKETGANAVAVFMLFYGSVTLCLGVTAVFRESALLLAGLVAVSALGIVTLISAGFSLIMIMSCIKDIIILALSFYYRTMIVMSDSPVQAAAVPGGLMPQPVDAYGNPIVGGSVYVDPNAVQIQQPGY